MNRTATLNKMKDYSALNICENMETQLLTNRTFNVKTGMSKPKNFMPIHPKVFELFH